MISDQADPQDELYLAVLYLNKRGISCRRLTQKYHISSRTWAKIRSKHDTITYHRGFLFRTVVDELNRLHQRTSDNDVLSVMNEVARVHAGLPRNKQVWLLIDEK